VPRAVALTVGSPDLSGELHAAFADAYRAGADALSAARGTEAAVGSAVEAAAAYADDRAGSLITGIDDTTEERVQGIIASAVQGGQSDAEVSDRLAALFGGDRADFIARTEMATAWNTGVAQAIADAGEDYVAVSDPDECGEDVCDVDGEIWTTDEALAEPLGHPNCGRDFRPLSNEELAEVMAEDSSEEAAGAQGGMKFAFDESLHPRNPGGSPEGGRWASATGTKRVWNGQAVPVKAKLNWRETGRIGEQVVTHYLEDKGVKVHSISSEKQNAPIDLVARNHAIEVKTGLVSNGPSAQHWRVTLGEPADKEKTWLKTATDAQKERHNDRKMAAAMARKESYRQLLSQRFGRELQPITYGVILHPDKGTADLYGFKGFHERIGWASSHAKAGFIGTMRYGKH
jgi:hypothetical protein